MPIIGTQQSPISIDSSKTLYVDFGAGYLQFKYSRPLPGEFAGDNFVFALPTPSENPDDWTLVVGGVDWHIRKIHIHSPSEHFLDSENPRPFEVHLLHSIPGDTSATGNKLVVGIFVSRQDGAEKPTIMELAKALRASKDSRSELDCTATIDLNPAEFLPDVGTDKWFRYEGSLTSPPFTEDVAWIVMNEDSAIPTEAFDALEECAHQHQRLPLPLNRRFVLRSFA